MKKLFSLFSLLLLNFLLLTQPLFSQEAFEEDSFEYNFFIRAGVYYSYPQQDIITSFNSVLIGFFYTLGNFKLEASGVTDFVFSNHGGDTNLLSSWGPLPRNRLFPLEYIHSSDSDLLVRLHVHRLYLTYASSNFNLKIGRQVISWGQGRFLNPLDLINPISVLTLDLESIAGVDALNASLFFNETDFLELSLIPHRRNNVMDYSNLRYNDVNALLRWKATYLDADIILLSGYHFHSLVWGFEAVRSFFSVLWRLAYLGRYEWEDETLLNSVSYSLPENNRHQIVFGADKVFLKKLRTNFEIFVNLSAVYDHETLRILSAYEALVLSELAPPLSQDFTFFRAQGRLITRNPVLLEFSFSYEFLAASSLGLFVVYDPLGSSGVFIPQLQCNIMDDVVWIFAGQFFVYHNENSEFYRGNMRIYSFIKFYF